MIKIDPVSLGVTLVSIIVSILVIAGVIPESGMAALSSNSSPGPVTSPIFGEAEPEGASPNPGEGPWTTEGTIDDQGTITVSQGDEVLSRAGSCTIGFIDRPAKIAFTAQHCIPVLDYSGQEQAYFPDGQVMGTFVYPKDYLPFSPLPDYEDALAAGEHKYDIVAIKLADNVIPGENIYTGDTRLPFSVVSTGEKVCFYGNTTRHAGCGTIVRKYRDHFVIQFHIPQGTTPDHGDSGGPIWIPGQGSIGVLMGSMKVTDSWTGTEYTDLATGY